MKPNLLRTATIITTFLSLAACGGPTEVDKVADAQNCLDQAKTNSEVDACVAKVSGIESQAAYGIRCTGKFSKEGFNSAAKLADAMSSLSGNTGASGSTAMMAALAFKTEATADLNSASAQEALEYCTKAKSKGLVLLSGLSQTATVVGAVGGADLTHMTGADLQTLMGTLASNPVATTAVGTAVVSIYQSNCLNNSTTSGNYCTQFDSAVKAVNGDLSDPAALGQLIMTCYNSPTTPGCTGF